jgi:hypothetical protein
LSRLMAQFRVSDASEDRLRKDLKSAAPHVFAKPAPNAPARGPTKSARREVARPAPKLAAASGSTAADWTEF